MTVRRIHTSGTSASRKAPQTSTVALRSASTRRALSWAATLADGGVGRIPDSVEATVLTR